MLKRIQMKQEKECQKHELSTIKNIQIHFSLKPTSIELKVKEQLDILGVRYIQQKRINDGKRNYFLDFYIPSLRLVIECNGDYWHTLPDKIERDKNLEKYVKSTGRNIIFIWEHEINDDWFWVGDYIEA